jgi:adenylate cyclase
MEAIWRWAWTHHGRHYSWLAVGLSYLFVVPLFVTLGLTVAGFEGSGRYLQAAAIAAVVLLITLCVALPPWSGRWRPAGRWAAGDRGDRLGALESTYALGRWTIVRGIVAYTIAGGVTFVLVGADSGATAGRLVQYGVVGLAAGGAVQLIAIHPYVEAVLRPVRLDIAADTGIGDGLPRSRPTFAAWSKVSILATTWSYALAGALLAAVIDRSSEDPLFAAVVATALTLAFAVPLTMGGALSPSLRPIRDLAEGTVRVARGEFGQPLPVVQDDDLGALTASFNRMQAGLAERQRLHAAFGSYVDPGLAQRLLEQGDDIFTGERVEVTVMFVDIRDFTPFAEANTAEDTVAHLNALFEIVVPAVIDAGGHANKYLGDGALAVFGAPNLLTQHAEAAIAAALQISRLVAERFDGAIRIGIGINSGQVIAGTIGGGGKLEFTLIGDTVNVAARVEQLTKTTGDTILLTEDTRARLAQAPAGIADRGAHQLKGKAAATRVHALA